MAPAAKNETRTPVRVSSFGILRVMKSFLKRPMSMIARTSLLALALMGLVVAPLAPAAHAASLEYSGWLPYWRSDEGIRDTRKHIEQLTEINPFGYTVKADGKLNDAMGIKSSKWQRLIRDARRADVRVVPTVMWSDTNNIDRILRDPKLRADHIREIVRMVDRNKFDGVDIDYEGKKAETKEFYSLFLKELDAALKDKFLACTIEPRTPAADKYTGTPPASAYIYANDFKEIGKYCDRVRIMTYDQSTIDQKLNKAGVGPYIPVADPKWVEKVVNLAAVDIAKDKLVIGAATYGYEYDVTANPSGTFTYNRLWSFNPRYATDLGRDVKLAPSRNIAGEMSLSYLATTTASVKPTQAALVALAPANAPTGNQVALGARAYAMANKVPVTFRLLWWSDTGAVTQLRDLASRLGIRGVAVFKLDGGSDPWPALQ